MKIYFLVFWFISISIKGFGQEAITFEEAKSKGLTTEYLDSLYANAIHSDKNLAVFKHHQKKYIEAYQNLLQDLGDYLHEHNFFWKKPTHAYNRIYFDKSGKIDYFIYSFRPDQILPEDEKIFRNHLSEFILNYIFPLSADRNFAQCSPVTYMPAEQ